MSTTNNIINQVVTNNSIQTQLNPPGNTFVGADAFSSNVSGTLCVAIGTEVLQENLTGSSNTSVGTFSMGYNQSGFENCAYGTYALEANISSDSSTAIGFASLTAALGNQNTGLGAVSLYQLVGGSGNLAAGYNAGQNYTGSESNNVLLANDGVLGESNVTRIGNVQTSCFIAGIKGVSQTAAVATVNSSGQVGAAAGIITAPVSSHTATAAFGSLTAGTAKQNTLGYDILLNISVSVTLATGATLTLGVGSTSTPTVDPVTASFTTLAVLPPIILTAIVPSNYYVLINTTGTITIGSITVQTCPL